MGVIRRALVTAAAAAMIAPCAWSQTGPMPTPLFEQADLVDYGIIRPQANDNPERTQCYHSLFDVCVPVIGQSPSNAVQNDVGPMIPTYLEDYKGITIHPASSDFYYIRQDHLQRLPGGLSAITSIVRFGVFGPYPAGATVKMRKGASYYFLWRCANGYRYQLVPAFENDAGQDAAFACA